MFRNYKISPFRNFIVYLMPCKMKKKWESGVTMPKPLNYNNVTIPTFVYNKVDKSVKVGKNEK
jgi:hypothetical protein